MQAKASGLSTMAAPMPALRARLAVVPLAGWVALALWPVWAYLHRAYTSPGADPSPALVLLGAVGWAAWVARSTAREEKEGAPAHAVGSEWARTLLVLALYAAAYPWAPPLARALLGLAALGLSLRALPGVPASGGWGLAALVVLAAPAVDTLSFFLGGPMRSAAAEVAVWALGALGNSARAEAGDAAFWVNGRLFSVDAPCSGVNGLWTGLVLAAAVATWRRLSFWSTALLLSASVLLCVPANGWRAATLVYLEVLAPQFGPLAGDLSHSLVGLLIFALTTGVLVGLSRPLSPGASCDRDPKPLSSPSPSSHAPNRNPNPYLYRYPYRHLYPYPLILAAFVPLLPRSAPATPAAQAFPGWPREWMGRPLRPLPASEMDRRWAALTPGPLTRFALPDGSELLLRWVDRPTRALHSPEDCYRGLGATLTPRPPVRAAAPGTSGPVLWRRFRVSRQGRSWEVRSLIRTESGATYSDPAWWWWRVAGPGAQDRGPWWAITLQTPL